MLILILIEIIEKIKSSETKHWSLTLKNLSPEKTEAN